MFLIGLIINTGETSCISKPAKKVHFHFYFLSNLSLNWTTFPSVILLLYRARAILKTHRILAPTDNDPSEHI